MDESIVKHLEAPARITKLSEAIRIGARIRPQVRSRFFIDGKSCALGAAYEGMTGFQPSEEMMYEHVLPVLGITQCLAESVAHKNDKGWTREAIADYLEKAGL